MRTIAWILFIYIFGSGLLPLKIKWYYKAAAGLFLLMIVQKNQLFLWFGGGMYFAPELPRFLILSTAFLYSACFIAFFLLILKDLTWGIWLLTNCIRKKKEPRFPRKIASMTVFGAALLIAAYGTWEALRIPEVRTEEIVLAKLPPELDGFTIVVLADLHASAMNTEVLLQKIVDKANTLKPDLMLLNGDIVDGTVENRRLAVAPLAELRAKYGVWGSPGNHEYLSGYREWVDALGKLGIQLLDNRHVTLQIGAAHLTLAGVTDATATRYGLPVPDIKAALYGSRDDAVRILMAHRPAGSSEHAQAGVDLQISGHTHGGMIIGLDRMIIAKYNEGFVSGHYQVGKMKLYVSRGSALWLGFPFRLGVPSEITRIVLRANTPF